MFRNSRPPERRPAGLRQRRPRPHDPVAAHRPPAPARIKPPRPVHPPSRDAASEPPVSGARSRPPARPETPGHPEQPGPVGSPAATTFAASATLTYAVAHRILPLRVPCLRLDRCLDAIFAWCHSSASASPPPAQLPETAASTERPVQSRSKIRMQQHHNRPRSRLRVLDHDAKSLAPHNFTLAHVSR